MKVACLACVFLLVLGGGVLSSAGEQKKSTNASIQIEAKIAQGKSETSAANQEISMITWLVLGGLVSILMVLIFLDVKVKKGMEEILNLLRYLSRHGDDASDGRESAFGRSLQEMASIGQVLSVLGREVGDQRDALKSGFVQLRSMLDDTTRRLDGIQRSKQSGPVIETTVKKTQVDQEAVNPGQTGDIQTFCVKHEIELINPGAGEIYNALRQEAVEYVNDPGVDANRIVRCKKPGLRYRGRVVAKAEVIVSRH